MQDLISALIQKHIHSNNDVSDYHFERVHGGFNGVIYRVSDADSNVYAAKIANRDARRRAWREYTITHSLHKADITNISPKGLYLQDNVSKLGGDVVISTWLDGDRLAKPPDENQHDTWKVILETLASLRQILPDRVDTNLPNAVGYVRNPIDMMAVVRDRLSRLPEGQSGQLMYEQVSDLVDNLNRIIPHQWQNEPPLCLVHNDTNPSNMLLHDGKISLVDWEGAGWSDPTFDIANIISNWRSFHFSDEHYHWLAETYANLSSDETAPLRIMTYATIQNVHWVVMYSRYLRTASENSIKGVLSPNKDHWREYQMKYCYRARRLLKLE